MAILSFLIELKSYKVVFYMSFWTSIEVGNQQHYVYPMTSLYWSENPLLVTLLIPMVGGCLFSASENRNRNLCVFSIIIMTRP